MEGGRAMFGLIFFPRGGSAQVARSLARALPDQGWDVTLVTGSLGHDGLTDASRFYAGLDVHAVDYTEAAKAPDPLAHDPPMQPSYEDREDAPDRVFARVDDAAYERLVECWSHALSAAGAAEADVLHLHHLTPIQEAARRVAPGVPTIAHVHGTELLMLEEIAQGPPPGWDHAPAWARRMRGWAEQAQRLVVLSETQCERMEPLLGVPADRCTVIPNGFDPTTFAPRDIDRDAHWRACLVEDPQGWAPGKGPGSVRYSEADLEPLREGTVLLYVGRYTAVKRLDLLIRAHARARERYERPAALVIVGGFPGEWEAEHPLETIRESGARDTYLAGWHEHAELPDMFAASDAVVLPSVREQFGQVLVEGMACGLPAVAVDAHGPSRIVDDGETGWLVAPDDEEAMAAALVEVVNDREERSRRGACARRAVAQRYAWPALAARVARLYREVLTG